LAQVLEASGAERLKFDRGRLDSLLKEDVAGQSKSSVNETHCTAITGAGA
jgi:hypothetical protein